MKLEQQITSLEISKKLKELGVKQESLFVWFDDKVELHYVDGDMRNSDISAFTVAELGEMLMKIKFADFGTFPAINNKIAVYTGEFLRKTALIDKQFEADNEAEARGKMLIYLLDNKLINL